MAIKDRKQHSAAGRGPCRGREGVPPGTARGGRRTRPSSHIPHRHLRKSGDLQIGVQAFSEGEVLLIGDGYAVPWAVDLAGRTLVWSRAPVGRAGADAAAGRHARHTTPRPPHHSPALPDQAKAKAMSPPRRRARSPLGFPAAVAMWPPKDLEAARRLADEARLLLLAAASGASSSGRSKK